MAEQQLKMLLRVIEALRGLPPELEAQDLQGDFDRWLAVTRALELAGQASIDLALAMLALRSTPPPDTYRAAFTELAARDVISSELADELAGWAGLRNVLAHMYTSVDPERLLDAVRNDLAALEQFARIVAGELLLEEGDPEAG